MTSRVGALVVLVALTGCYAGSFELNDGSLGTPNMTLSPILPKHFNIPLHRAITLNSLNSLNSLKRAQSKVVGPPCSSGATLAVPAGGSVTFTSPTPPTKALRATYNLCGWKFTTVPGSTFTLTCPSFSLSGRDSLYVYEYRFFLPFVYRFRTQSFPSRLVLNARTVKVLFLYDRSGNKGYFSCTITASGGTTTSTTSPTTTTTSSSTSVFLSSSSTTTSTSTTTGPDVTKNCRCGIVKRTLRIIGGVNTQENEYPWQVGVMLTGSRFVFCGGSLISDRYIVTAALCTKEQTTSTFRLLLGGHTKDSPSAMEKIVDPIRIIAHPQYQVGGESNNNIAIIEIAPLNFNDPTVVARPVCLPNSPDTYDGVTATVTGWGTLSLGGEQPDILQEVDIPVVTNAFCTTVHGPAITISMICAGTAAGGKDVCQGDSGGPLIAPDGANYELIGVANSAASECGQPSLPGVYARVTVLQSWIDSNIVGSTTCGR